MDRSDITLERMRTFTRVAERGNLSAVARETGAGQSTITRHLKELEEAVGASLLSRTTRRVTLTDEGRRFYSQCLQILSLVDHAIEDIRIAQGVAKGIIRVSCTAALGVLHITKLIFRFQELYPQIHIDLSLSDERVDLVKEGFDIALRLGPLADSSMKLRQLGQSGRILVAAPGYLAEHGRLSQPEDISGHNVIRMSNIASSERLVLQDVEGERHDFPVFGNLRVDHGLAAREAVRAGRGIAAAHHWLVDDLLADGRLEAILPDYALPATPLNMLIVPERSNVLRVRLLIDYLVEEIRKLPGIG